MIEITKECLEILTEIGNIGAGHAADALSAMINKQILMTVPRVRMSPTEQVINEMDKEKIIAALYFDIEGITKGAMILIFPEKSASYLIDTLIGNEPESTKIAAEDKLPEMEESTIKEVGNVLVCHFSDAIANITNGRLTPSVPYLAIDLAGAIVQSVFISVAERYDNAIVFETQLKGDGEAMEASLLFLPDQDTFLEIISKLSKMDAV